MPARKPKPRARRSAPVAWPRLPQLEQRQLDLIGLGLVAAAVFFAFLIYLGWDGGEAGGWAVDGLRWLVGAVHYGVPVALVAAGAILVLRPVLPAVRPIRSGGLCCSPPPRSASRPARSASARAATPCAGTPSGCARAAGWSARACTGAPRPRSARVGAHIVALFLFLAAVLLLTGASVAGVVKATTDSVSTTTRDMRAAVQRRRATEELEALEPARAAGVARRRRRRGMGRTEAVLVGRGALPGAL